MIIKSIDCIHSLINNNPTILIFGNGYVSSLILDFFSDYGVRDKIDSIVTTEKERADFGQTVRIDEVAPEKRHFPIIVATSTPKHHEISLVLGRGGFDQVHYISDELVDAIERQNREKNKDKEDELIQKLIDITNQNESIEECDFLFFSVPYWDVYSPFSAVPCLEAYLKSNKLAVKYYDLGIKAFHEALKDEWKSISKKFFTRTYYYERVRKCRNNKYDSYDEYINALWFFMKERIDISEIKERYGTMSEVQKGILSEFYEAILSRDILPINFNTDWNVGEEIEKRNYLPFLKALLSVYSNEGRIYKPKVLGISVTGTGQFMHACFLATILKQIYKGVPIVWGGSCADYFVNSFYPHKKDILEYFDYIMVGEGETSLLKLYRCVGEDGDVSSVSNLVFIHDDNNVEYNEQVLEDVEKLPPPDYSDVDFGEYISPNLVLPYQASRGCHYGYCAFCNHDAKYRHNYRTKSGEKVARDLLGLMHSYNTYRFQFVDEAIKPNHFISIISEMEKHDEFFKSKWFYYSRVSREYTENILRRAKKVGCEMVMFGVETYNQRLLNFIKKGISAETSRYCLKLFHDCGIKTYEWLMCNLPSESIDEMKKDFEDIKEWWEYVDSVGIGLFMLEINTDMYKDPHRFNIEKIDTINPIMFQSTDVDGNMINKEEVISYFYNVVYPEIDRRFFAKDRYSLFFRE